ncbi:hypothetical protein B0H19DRAFT_1067714 [Mycena capillaripes]|nr:hypothetical protein B0H19DRAFT_1067714 [Mycena capillaripes]
MSEAAPNIFEAAADISPREIKAYRKFVGLHLMDIFGEKYLDLPFFSLENTQGRINPAAFKAYMASVYIYLPLSLHPTSIRVPKVLAGGSGGMVWFGSGPAPFALNPELEPGIQFGESLNLEPQSFKHVRTRRISAISGTWTFVLKIIPPRVWELARSRNFTAPQMWMLSRHGSHGKMPTSARQALI